MGVRGLLRSSFVKLFKSGLKIHKYTDSCGEPGYQQLHAHNIQSTRGFINAKFPTGGAAGGPGTGGFRPFYGESEYLWKRSTDKLTGFATELLQIKGSKRLHGCSKDASLNELSQWYFKRNRMSPSSGVGALSRLKSEAVCSASTARRFFTAFPVVQAAQAGRWPPSPLKSLQGISHRKLHWQSGQQLTFRRSYGTGPEMVWGLLLANGAVFLAWQVLDPRFMAANFMVSDGNIRSGRYHTLLTSAFSHKDFSHLFTNMLGLYFFGTELCQLFGGRYLLSLYLAGGITASICHVVYFRYIVPDMERRKGHWAVRQNAPALGASGAVNAVVLLNCLLFPTRIIYLNLFIPVPGILLGIGFIVQDLIGATKSGSSIGHAAHLGGAFVGFLAWILVRIRRF